MWGKSLISPHPVAYLSLQLFQHKSMKWLDLPLILKMWCNRSSAVIISLSHFIIRHTVRRWINWMDEVFVGLKGSTIGTGFAKNKKQNNALLTHTSQITCHRWTCCLSDGLSWHCSRVSFVYVCHKCFNSTQNHLSQYSENIQEESGWPLHRQTVIRMQYKAQQHLPALPCFFFFFFRYRQPCYVEGTFPLYVLRESGGVRCNSWTCSRWWFYGSVWQELTRGMLIAGQDETSPAQNSCPRLLHY